MSTADVSHGHRIVAAVWSLVSLSGLFVTLKILARARRRMRWWWDDYLMFISWVRLVASRPRPIHFLEVLMRAASVDSCVL